MTSPMIFRISFALRTLLRAEKRAHLLQRRERAHRRRTGEQRRDQAHVETSHAAPPPIR